MTCLFMPGTEEAAKFLGPLEKQAVKDPPYPHWLRGKGSDSGLSYCRSCAVAAQAIQKSINRNAAKRRGVERAGCCLDGGWSQEEDTCCQCETCGCVLDYDLTDEGVEEELAHYSDVRFPPLTEIEAYHIARIVWGAPTDERVLRLARRAVAAIAKAKGE